MKCNLNLHVYDALVHLYHSAFSYKLIKAIRRNPLEVTQRWSPKGAAILNKMQMEEGCCKLCKVTRN